MHGIENVKKIFFRYPTHLPLQWSSDGSGGIGQISEIELWRVYIYIYSRNIWVAYISLVEIVEMNVP